MKRILISLTMLGLCSSAIAEPNLIVCEFFTVENAVSENCEVGEVNWRRQFLVETDDFNKENPEYEFESSYTCREDEESFNKDRGFGSVRKNIGYKQKYRYKYQVTPTTLSFHFLMVPELEQMADKWMKMDINRETLTGKEGNGMYQCRIEEVKLGN